MNGERFHFAGFNNYYLPIFAADPHYLEERTRDVDVVFRFGSFPPPFAVDNQTCGPQETATLSLKPVELICETAVQEQYGVASYCRIPALSQKVNGLHEDRRASLRLCRHKGSTAVCCARMCWFVLVLIVRQ